MIGCSIQLGCRAKRWSALLRILIFQGLDEMKYIVGAMLVGSVLLVGGCSSPTLLNGDDYSSKQTQTVSSSSGARSEEPPSLTKSQETKNYGIGVNGYLWRSCLDILSFMPLSSADPFGGVIITDWYSPSEAPRSRFKVTAYILSSSLQSDALRISVFRQVRTDSGEWQDIAVNGVVSSDLENTVLARARELKVRTNPR